MKNSPSKLEFLFDIRYLLFVISNCMPLRTCLFIIISIIVLFVLVVSVSLLVVSKKKAVAPAAVGESSAPAGANAVDSGNLGQLKSLEAVAAPVNLPIKPSTELETEQNAAKQMAKIFVERYNTFSTDNNLQNIREVKELVTPALWKKISARLKNAVSASLYLAVTTEAISSSIVDWQDITAQVAIQARKTTRKNDATATAQETITVVMAKQGGNWLVDSYTTAKP